MRTLIGSVLLTISLSSMAHTGFKSGNNYEYYVKKGEALVRCPLRNSVREVWCESSDVSPSAQTRFHYEGEHKVTKVQLTSRHAQGTVSTKNSKMKNAQSQKNFLMWWPFMGRFSLLREGNNNVEYTLYAGNQEVEKGTIDVNLKIDSRVRYCSDEEIVAPGRCLSDREACDLYFAKAECI